MLVVMQQGATEGQLRRVVQTIRELGFEPHPIVGRRRTAVGIVGNDAQIDAGRLSALDGVRDIIHVTQPYRQVSREWKPDDTVITFPGGLTIGAPDIVVIAGPCAVESKTQILDVAHAVREAGASVLRGGAFKPRSSPYSFQGIGLAGLELLALAREETGLLIVTEAIDPDGVEIVQQYADIIQIGARSMQNYSLLKQAGRAAKPVLLKRGIAATVTELLLSAEYIAAEGNEQIVLCERGIRGFDSGTRNVLDLASIPVIQKVSHLPVIADPSHGTGARDLVAPMARAAIAAGADGIMVEVHPAPEEALSDGAQSLYPKQFAELVRQVRQIAEAVGRRIADPLQAPVQV
jgi:3-deoxy-7-phosphoheptulonate synthase